MESLRFNSRRENDKFSHRRRITSSCSIKFSSNTLEVKDLQTVLPKHLGIKGNCLVGLLAHRHILLRIDQYEDYVVALSFLPFHESSIFPWTTDFNSREETSMAGFRCLDYHQIYLPRDPCGRWHEPLVGQ